MENVFKNNEYTFNSKQITIPNDVKRKISLINYERKANGNVVICEEFCYEGAVNDKPKQEYPSKSFKEQNLKYIKKNKQHS